jgi:hypothetical protein
MTDFALLFRATAEGQRAAMGTPADAQRSLENWLAWIQNLEQSGRLKDRGQPLAMDGKVVSGRTVTDGPFTEVKDILLGFIIVTAEHLDAAAEIAKACPIAIGGGSVEVRPIGTLDI